MIDNVLCNGQVVDSAFDDADTLATRHLNEKIHAVARATISLLPIADGLTLGLKFKAIKLFQADKILDSVHEIYNHERYARALTGVSWSRFVFIQSPSLNHRGVRAI